MYINLLTKIKNAQAAKKKFIKVGFSKMDHALLTLLERAGFFKKVEIKGRLPKRVIEIEFKEDHPIRQVKFLSKPSRRLYAGYKDLSKVRGGYGMGVLSTSEGIMSYKEAKKKKVGGQLLFEIW